MLLLALGVALAHASAASAACTLDCGPHGKCVDAECLCDLGFFGAACDERPCPLHCSGHGSCHKGVCSCDAGFGGEACEAATTTAVTTASLPLEAGGGLLIEQATAVVAASAAKAANVSLGGWGCGPEACHGRGECLMGTCSCSAAYYGDQCQWPRCKNDCYARSHRGECTMGMCTCNAAFTGDDCGTPVSTTNIVSTAGRQKAVNIGAIVAAVKAVEDESLICPQKCNDQGKCGADGTCQCYSGYTGIACENFCPNSCSGRGECISGGCLCFAGWGAVDCSIPVCCNSHGDCPEPDTCICHKGWLGPQCGIPAMCADPTCNNHGKCNSGSCDCEGGWSGTTCETAPEECGTCPPGAECNRMTGECLCGGTVCAAEDAAGAGAGAGAGAAADAGAGGGAGGASKDDAKQQGGPGAGAKIEFDGEMKAKATTTPAPKDESKLVKDCGAHGVYNGTLDICECTDPLWFGDLCERKHCPAYDNQTDTECSGQGVCLTGECYCMAGFGLLQGKAGPNICKDKVPIADCGAHGEFKDGMCVCEPGWKGQGCKEPSCPNDCTGHGICTFTAPDSPAECKCEVGWRGGACDIAVTLKQCPNDCSGNGLCMDGQCACGDSWTGPDCSTRVCTGMFLGPRCDMPACPNDCDGKGLCMHGECACWQDWLGKDCSIPVQCYEPCGQICTSDSRSEQCEFCKGRCLELVRGGLGRHSWAADLS